EGVEVGVDDVHGFDDVGVTVQLVPSVGSRHGDGDAGRLEAAFHLVDVTDECGLTDVAAAQHLTADDGDVDVTLNGQVDQGVDLGLVGRQVPADGGTDGRFLAQPVDDLARGLQVGVGAEDADPV